jgi:hypothetical protein
MLKSPIHILKTGKLKEAQELWTVMYCSNAEEVEACITDPTVIWPLIYSSLVTMADEDRDSVIVLELRCVGVSGSVWVTLRTSDVLGTLEKMLVWREEREEYEECSDIITLRSRWIEIIEKREAEGREGKSPAAPDSLHN